MIKLVSVDADAKHFIVSNATFTLVISASWLDLKTGKYINRQRSNKKYVLWNMVSAP